MYLIIILQATIEQSFRHSFSWSSNQRLFETLMFQGVLINARIRFLKGAQPHLHFNQLIWGTNLESCLSVRKKNFWQNEKNNTRTNESQINVKHDKFGNFINYIFPVFWNFIQICYKVACDWYLYLYDIQEYRKWRLLFRILIPAHTIALKVSHYNCKQKEIKLHIVLKKNFIYSLQLIFTFLCVFLKLIWFCAEVWSHNCLHFHSEAITKTLLWKVPCLLQYKCLSKLTCTFMIVSPINKENVDWIRVPMSVFMIAEVNQIRKLTQLWLSLWNESL